MKKVIIFCLFFSLLMTIPLHTQAREVDLSAGEEFDDSTQNIYTDDIRQGAIDLYNFGKELSDFKGSTPTPRSPTGNPQDQTSPLINSYYSSVGTLGTSTDGFPIEVYEFGNGPDVVKIVFIGGMHGGYEWNTILLAYKAIDYITQNPSIIPYGLKIQIIPSANPDGQMRSIGKVGRFDPPWQSTTNESSQIEKFKSGRFNGNESSPKPVGVTFDGVDLNRNWSCRHQSKAFWGSTPVNAGTGAFSEKETQVLKNFLQKEKPNAVVFWHSRWSAVFAAGCDKPYEESISLQKAYAQASGYTNKEWVKDNNITGDVTDWLADIGIPAITAELKSHTEIDWNENLAGIQATIKHVSHKLPQQSLNNLTMYRQTDYTQNLPGGCTIAYAGCGPVAAANIITYFTGQQINPVDVARKYTGANLANCEGSSPNGSANVLASYGFRTKLLFASQHLTINEAAKKLLPYIKQGNVIHAGGQFYYHDKDGVYRTSGHFFVILDIKKLDNGDYDFIGLDSAYGNRNVIPVSYRKLGQLLYVRHAVSVSR